VFVFVVVCGESTNVSKRKKHEKTVELMLPWVQGNLSLHGLVAKILAIVCVLYMQDRTFTTVDSV